MGKLVNTRILTSDFEYFEPKTVREAVDLLDKYGKDAKVLAGGSNLIVDMKIGKFSPKYLIYIGKIPELKFVSRGNGGVRIGTETTFHSIIKSEEMNGYAPLLEALKSIQVEIQRMGTIGGNLCNAAPTASSATPLLSLNARVKVVSAGDSRTIPLSEFFAGNRKTVLATNELLTEVQIPMLGKGEGGAFTELIRRKIRVAVVLGRQGDLCKFCRISIGGAVDMPKRARKAESILEGKKFDERSVSMACSAASEEVDPEKWYAREVVKDLGKKALERAWERAKG